MSDIPKTQNSQDRSRSWRDILPTHPAAELFPLMSPDELKALGEDIVKNGLTSPITVCRTDCASVQLVDGRNRLDAMELAGLHFKLRNPKDGYPCLIWEDDHFSRVHEISPDEVLDYVISANIHRRHLTAEQKRELIAKLIKATPEKSDRQIAETVKASPTTVGTVRAKMEAKGDVSKLDTRRDTEGRQQRARKPWSRERWVAKRAEGVTKQNSVCAKIARDDIGLNSASENARLQARNEELERENHRLQRENQRLARETQRLAHKLGLFEFENAELKRETKELREHLRATKALAAYEQIVETTA